MHSVDGMIFPPFVHSKDILSLCAKCDELVKTLRLPIQVEDSWFLSEMYSLPAINSVEHQLSLNSLCQAY